MSAGQQMPPWLQEQIAKMQQSQQNLQSILMQKQQVEMENAESDRALEELKTEFSVKEPYPNRAEIICSDPITSATEAGILKNILSSNALF